MIIFVHICIDQNTGITMTQSVAFDEEPNFAMECQGPFSVILQMLSSESRMRGGTTLLGMCVSSPDSGTVAEQQPKCNCKKGRNLIQWLQMETHLKIIVLFKRARWMGSSCRRFFLGNER